MRKILYISNLSLKKSLPSNGQIVKARNILDVFNNINAKIFVIDTGTNKALSFLKFCFLMLFCRTFIICLSQGGRKHVFKVLSFLTHFKKIKIIHFLVGGFFPKQLRENSKLLRFSQKFLVHYVESSALKKEMNDLGLINVEVLTNFRVNLNKIPHFDYYDNCYNFIIFSRLSKLKGTDIGINVIGRLFHEGYRCFLYIYGPIEEEFKEEFAQLLEKYKECVFYKGIASDKNIITSFENKFALLFPTRWKWEGIPGSIIDSFSCSVPVICSDWESCSDIVSNNYNGFVFNLEDAYNGLYECVLKSINNKDRFILMREHSFEESKKYRSEIYIERIKEKLFR